MTWQIRFGQTELSDLRAALLHAAPRESGAILLCNRGGAERLLVERVVAAAQGDFRVQTEERLEFEPAFLARALKTARDERLSVLLVHTHPTAKWPSFSVYDDRGEASLIPAIMGRILDRPHGAMVLGEAGFSSRIYEEPDKATPVEEIVEVGAHVVSETINPNTSEFGDLFDRNVRTFGSRGQQAISRLKVGIVGLGGTGSLVAEQLAHLGVRSLTLIDDDRVEETNLNRVVGSSLKDIGRSKVDVASEMVSRISTGKVGAEPFSLNILDQGGVAALLKADFVFCCTDSHGSRAAINQLAYQFLVPVIDLGVRIDARDGVIQSMNGRVQMLSPGLPCLQCQRLLDAEQVRRDLLTDEDRIRDPYIVGAAEPQPAVISLNGTVASLAVTMFLSAVAGVPMPARRLNYRISEGIVKPAVSSPDPLCFVCSNKNGGLAKGFSWPLLLRSR